MEHKTALTVAAAVVAVGGSGAVALGTLTGAIGPNIDPAATVTAAAEQLAAVQPVSPERLKPTPRPVQRVTRYVDVPMPAPGTAPAALTTADAPSSVVAPLDSTAVQSVSGPPPPAPVAAPAPPLAQPAVPAGPGPAPAAPHAPPAAPATEPGDSSAGGPVSHSPVKGCTSAEKPDAEADKAEDLREVREEACEEGDEAREDAGEDRAKGNRDD